MALDRSEVIEVHRRRARRYDFTANLYYLIGFRLGAYRRAAVARLALRPGDTVVEVGCGTGLNFSLLERAVGTCGTIIGVDLRGCVSLSEADDRSLADPRSSTRKGEVQ